MAAIAAAKRERLHREAEERRAVAAAAAIAKRERERRDAEAKEKAAEAEAERERSRRGQEAEEEMKRKSAEEERERSRREQEAKAEEMRVRREKPENLKRDQEANKWQESMQISWQSAWARYLEFEKICMDGTKSGTHFNDREIEEMRFWPTKLGLYHLCNESDVREFFAHKPAEYDRKMMLQQARRWHKDRAMVFFDHAWDRKATHKAVTMVTQVIDSIIASE